MPRGVDPILLAALTQPTVRPAVFVHIGFENPVGYWSGNVPIIFQGRTYSPSGQNIRISNVEERMDQAQPKLSVSVDGIQPGALAEPFKLTNQKLVFSYTGADQFFNVPSGAREMIVKSWGADGGPDVYAGGVGGYTRTHHRCNAGETYAVVVGQSGINLTTVYGFGGTGQGAAHQHNGGGMSGVFLGNSGVGANDSNRAINIAGGGGAGGWNGSRGHSGYNGNAPDAGGMTNFQGQAATGGISAGFGGGGGGYRGGKSVDLWGVGGSGFAAASPITPNELLASPWPSPNPPNASDPDYNMAGQSVRHGVVAVEFVGTVSSYEPIAYVHFGAVDYAGNLLGTPQLLFRGSVESLGWEVGEVATAIFNLIGVHDIVEPNTGAKYSDAAQRRKYPADKGLEFLASLQNVRLRWGGIE